MELLKASDLKKIFVKWSQGTLYNRLTSLNIKDNKEYIIKNEVTGIDQYNSKAVELLKVQYIKEFFNNSAEEKEKIDKIVFNYLSNKSNEAKTKENEQQKSQNNLKNDNVDNIDNSNKVNNVNISYINENYILKELHQEIVDNLKSQIDILQKQLEKETANNENLVETIKMREQKEVVIEQQNLVKLRNNVKLIADPTEEIKKDRKGRGIFALFRKNE